MASAAATAPSASPASRSSSTGTPCPASSRFDAASERVLTASSGFDLRPSICGRRRPLSGPPDLRLDGRGPALPVLVAQDALQQLARVGARQLGAHLVLARPLVVRE